MKRTPISDLPHARRGGTDAPAENRDEDSPSMLSSASTHAYILNFTNTDAALAEIMRSDTLPPARQHVTIWSPSPGETSHHAACAI